MVAPFPRETGTPLPFGATHGPGWINFSLFSRHALSVTLLVRDETGYVEEIRLDPAVNRTGDIWHIRLLTDHPLIYGYRVGNANPAVRPRDCQETVLIDPYCRSLQERPWGMGTWGGCKPVCRAFPQHTFDWQGDRPLRTPIGDTVIYELHVRGFTKHPSSHIQAPGTFRGLIEKIGYLQDLGITAVELLPITAWDEMDNRFFHPENGTQLRNYWGYNPVSFFALHTGLAERPDQAIDEFKTMVRSFHQAGIEIILDMVFNHTGETDKAGTTSSLRGIDDQVYYLTDPQTGEYLNFTGCGNTVNCNHPVVRRLILDALHYWVEEMHVDGFRFDLAAIFSRGSDGAPRTNAPLIEEIAESPMLRDTKIIAEAWDAAGLYQVGSFSADRRWLEWNGRYRDDLRRFLTDMPDSVSILASRLAGSSDIYGGNGRGPLNSINFVTSHDGFTLYDLVSYNDKRNNANGEDSRDGENNNFSWNSGCEGDPCHPAVRRLRFRRIRTFLGLLLFSQGIPMLSAGDEFGRTQYGNNNAWCQDNETSWIDWSLAQTNKDLQRFVRFCITLRKSHPCFRRSGFFPAADDHLTAHPEISWQAHQPGIQNWSGDCRSLGWLLHDPNDSSDFFFMVNGSRSEQSHFVIPAVPPRGRLSHWRKIIDTSASSPDDCLPADQAAPVATGGNIIVPAMGLVVLQTAGPQLTLGFN